MDSTLGGSDGAKARREVIPTNMGVGSADGNTMKRK
jgi:hypothetical protein